MSWAFPPERTTRSCASPGRSPTSTRATTSAPATSAKPSTTGCSTGRCGLEREEDKFTAKARSARRIGIRKKLGFWQVDAFINDFGRMVMKTRQELEAVATVVVDAALKVHR